MIIAIDGITVLNQQALVYTPHCPHDRFSNCNNNSIIIEAMRPFAKGRGGRSESRFALESRNLLLLNNYSIFLRSVQENAICL